MVRSIDSIKSSKSSEDGEQSTSEQTTKKSFKFNYFALVGMAILFFFCCRCSSRTLPLIFPPLVQILNANAITSCPLPSPPLFTRFAVVLVYLFRWKLESDEKTVTIFKIKSNSLANDSNRQQCQLSSIETDSHLPVSMASFAIGSAGRTARSMANSLNECDELKLLH